MSKTIYRDGIEEPLDGPISVRTTRDGHVVESYSSNGVPRFFATLAGSHFCAHGGTPAAAIADALWKDPAKRPSRDALVEEIRKAGPSRLITLAEFRLLTGACLEGCRIALRRAGLPEEPMTALDVRDKVSREWGDKLLEILNPQPNQTKDHR